MANDEMKLEQVKDIPGRLSVWRDPVTKLEFSTYGRDVPVGYLGFSIGLEDRQICSVEAKRLETLKNVDGSVTSKFYIPLAKLKRSYELPLQSQKKLIKKYLGDASFQDVYPLFIEGWEVYWHSHHGSKIFLKITLDEKF